MKALWSIIVAAAGVAALVAILVAATAPESSGPAPTLTRGVEVVSGQQMERIPLGATVEEVTGLLGEPVDSSVHEDARGVTTYLYYPYGTDFGQEWQLAFENDHLRAKHQN